MHLGHDNQRSDHTALFGRVPGPVQAANSRTKQLAIAKHMDQLLGSDAVMTLPTALGPAPKLNSPVPVLEDVSNQLIMLTSIASLAGLPQVSLFGLKWAQACSHGL